METPAGAVGATASKRTITRRLTVAVAALLAAGVLGSITAAAPVYTDWSAPVNLGPPVNTSIGESGPALSADGLSLYFFSSNDLWVSRRPAPDASWGVPVNLGPTINTAAAEAFPALSTDGHWLFFASNRVGGLGGQDLYQAYRPDVHDDLGWQTPTNLGANVNTAGDENAAGYFENGGHPQLFFSSGPSSPFFLDLYLTDRQPDGTWGVARLISELSTSDAEQRPSLRSDGLEIFFHSSRPGTLGGGDLWAATRPSTTAPWSTPVKLASLNTTANDIHANISADGKTLLWSSQRPGGLGGGDLWMATREQVLPATKDDCKHGGWENFGVFANQGDCVSWIATGGKNPPG